jgi:hypothetical protein
MSSMYDEQYKIAILKGNPVSPTRARLRKATFNLPEDVLGALDQAVREGVAPSKNAFVERAISRELDDIERIRRKVLWEEASHDPLFVKDLLDTEQEFRTADAETARSIG